MKPGMTFMHKAIFVLTGLLFLVGMILLLSGNVNFGGDDATFGDETSYEDARGKGDLPPDAPDMPKCARDIEIVGGAETNAIVFTCDNKQERDAFVAYVKNGFIWDVFILDGNRVRLERANVDQK